MPAFWDLVLLGSDDVDEFRGENGDDMIIGNDGDDIMSGGGGKDLMIGGRGIDYMLGGNGRDQMFGGEGNDVMYGGSGRDYLSGDAGSDRLIGGNGRDTFAFDVGGALLGDGVDRVQDFVVGVDKILIVNGLAELVSFVDEGNSLGVYYDGIKIAFLEYVSSVPEDTSVLFGGQIVM